MAENKTKKEPVSVIFSKIALGVCAVVSFIVVASIVCYVITKKNNIVAIPPGILQIKSIKISSDAKAIIDSETKKVIFTIDDANKYLKESGYAYDPDTFQTTDAKYAGDCFLGAVMSNNKDKIVFSSGCLAGDLPQAWIGVYDFGTIKKTLDCSGLNNGIISTAYACIGAQKPEPSLNFLIGGSGKNFVWSQDDKTITYEADLGLSGLTETRTIDSVTGEVLDRRNAPVTNNSENADWKTYRNEQYGFELKYPEDWNEKESLDNNKGVLLLNTSKEIIIGGAAPDDFFSSDGREINPKYTNDWMGIQIDAYSKPANFSWDSWIKNNFPVVEKYESYNHEGLQGIRVTELNGLFYGEPNIFIEGKKIYNIRLFNDYPYNTERDLERDVLVSDYFNQILSTFKFVEPEK